MYIMIIDIVVEKGIDLTYPIWGKEVAMFSNNIQYQIREFLKVLLITNEEKQLLKGTFMDRELDASIGRKLITTPLNANDNITKMDKLACITEVVLSSTWKTENSETSYLGIM